MKRLLVITCGLLLTLALALAGFGTWCLGTPDGASWLLTQAGRLGGVAISTARIDGSLLGGLEIAGLEIAWRDGSVRSEATRLDLRLSALLSGRLAVARLETDRLTLHKGNAQTETAGPESEGSNALPVSLPDWLEVEIDRLKVTRFAVADTTAGTETLIADLIAGRYHLTGSRLSARGFAYHSPAVALDGDFDWDLARPHLVMTAQVGLPASTADPDRFAELSLPVAFPVRLELEGDWNGYTGSIGVEAEKPEGETSLNARVQGSWRGLRLEDLAGRYLGGTLAGQLDLAWDDDFSLQGAIAAQGLDLSGLIDGVTGSASFDLTGKLLAPGDDRPLQADFALHLHEGRFRGHALQGRAAGRLVDGQPADLDVDIRGDGARLLAKGSPAQKIDIDLEVADLAAFHDRLAGAGSLRGWLRHTDGELTGDINGRASRLTWDETHIEGLAFHARREEPVGPIDLQLTGHGLRQDRFRVDKLTAEVSGTTGSHRIALTATTQAGDGRARATGSYSDGRWTGRIEEFKLRTGSYGSWALADPIATAWAAGTLSTAPMQLRGDRSARLELTVTDWTSADQANLALDWKNIDLGWLQPLAGIATLTGRTDGELRYAASPGTPPVLHGRLSAQGRAADRRFDADIRALAVQFGWDRDGLKLNGSVTSAAGEELQGSLTSPTPPDRLQLPSDFDADLEWRRLDLQRLDRGLARETAPHVFTGLADGRLRYAVRNGAPARLEGQVAARGAVRAAALEVAYDELALEFKWDDDGLALDGALSTPADETVRARMRAPSPPAWQWPISGLAVELQWRGVDLARFGGLLEGSRVEASSEGEVALTFAGRELAGASARLKAQGHVLQGEQEIGPRSLETALDWNAGGFRCVTDLVGPGGGHATLELTSGLPPALAWPETGRIDLEISRLSLTALAPLLPAGLEVAGFFNGQAEGSWHEHTAFTLAGGLKLNNSQIAWDSDGGKVSLPLRDARVDWDWRDGQLSGDFALLLAEHGNLAGRWRLPLPARLPTALPPDGRLQASLEGRMQAAGLLSAIGPWLLQDVRGETAVNASLGGTWAAPQLEGALTFRDGTAYLPTAGVLLEGIQLRTELAGERVRVTQLELRSGPGSLSGTGELDLDRWALSGYRFELIGKDLEVVNFPELHALCNPELKLSGTPEKLVVEGAIFIPTLAIGESKAVPEVVSSKDVVIATAGRQRAELGFATDIHVVVELGDHVTVNSGGMETGLTGGAILTMGPRGEILAEGEVQMVAGTFRSYGTRLDIRQGILHFRGGPIKNPDLRIFAAREVGSVLAGVQVTGSAEAPVVSLYSRPAMPERDILGYILTGRAINTEKLDSNVLALGAGTLLPGYGETFSQLGLTDIDIQGLFAGLGGVRLRRQFAERWEVESVLGVESGVDLYYIFEFE